MDINADRHKFICATIFYSQDSWHILLQNFIYPLMYEINDIDKNFKWNLSLNLNRGEGINLSICTSSKKIDKILSVFDRKTSVFLRQFPSKNKRLKLEGNKIFRDFKNNSVCYNLCSNPFLSSNFFSIPKIGTVTLDQILTMVIGSILAKEKITDESIFTIFIYLLVLLVNCISLGRKNFYESLKNYCDCYPPDQKCEYFAFYNSVFLENRELINEIIDDIFNDKYPQRMPDKWMNDWLNACKRNFIIKRNESGNYMTKIQFIENVSQLVGRQLGFVDHVNKIIFFMLQKYVSF